MSYVSGAGAGHDAANLATPQGTRQDGARAPRNTIQQQLESPASAGLFLLVNVFLD